MQPTFLVLASMAAIAIAFGPPAPPPQCSTTAPNCDIVALAESIPDLSTLVFALKAAGLTKALSGKGNFTVFAPSNEAFAALPASTLARLLLNKTALAEILTYHVIAGSTIKFNDLQKPSTNAVKSLQGDILEVDRVCTDRKCGKSKIKINPLDGYLGRYEAFVTNRDNLASNGVIHIINSVLRQPNHLYFAAVRTDGSGCGEVDAAPRMPVALFDAENAAKLKQYADITVQLYTVSPSIKKLVVGQCKDLGYNVDSGTSIRGPWAPTALMAPICKEKCNCDYPNCKDQPDDPDTGTFCSLCGPMFNSDIGIEVFTKAAHHTM